MRAPALALLWIALLGCATGGAWSAPPDPPVDTAGWHEVRMPAFQLYGNVDEEVLRSLAADLALFDAVVRKVTNTRIDRSRLPVRLYVVRDRAQAKAVVPAYAAGVIYPRLDGYYSAMDGEDPDFWTRETLLHEYTHYVLRGDRRTPLPRWYDEGLSEFLSVMRGRDDAILIGRADSGHLKTLARWGTLPLPELFDVRVGARVNMWQFYATAWALVHHLNTSDALRPQLLAYVRRLVRGEPWRAAFDASFEPSLEELEASLAQHVAFLRRGGRRDFHLPRSRVAVPDVPPLVAVPRAEIAYQLGEVSRAWSSMESEPEEIARARSRAQALYEHALGLDPRHARARAALGWALAEQGRFEDAAAAVAALPAGASDDSAAALDVARIAALQESAAPGVASTARALVERAIALAPEAPGGHLLLAEQLAAAGERDAAIAAFERARALGSFDPTLDLELARQYLDGGRWDRARALLRPLASDQHAGGLADEARQMLEELEVAAGSTAP